MRRSSLAWFSALGALAVVACSNQDTTPPDSGADASLDASGDAAGDAPEEAPGQDGGLDGGCAAGSSLYYANASCSAQPACLGDGQDACLGVYCGCDGVTFNDGCDYAKKPFLHRGSCGGTGEGGPFESGTEAGSDADASPDGTLGDGDASEAGSDAAHD